MSRLKPKRYVRRCYNYLKELGLDPELIRMRKHAVFEVRLNGKTSRIACPVSPSDSQHGWANWKKQAERKKAELQ